MTKVRSQNNTSLTVLISQEQTFNGKHLTILLSVLTLFFLAGCQSSGSDSSVDDAAQSGEICNITGEWDAKYKNDRSGINRDIIKFTQTGNNFSGIKMIGNENVGKGEKSIEGTMKVGGFKRLQVFHSAKGWIGASSKINAACDEIVIRQGGAVIRLNRKEV